MWKCCSSKEIGALLCRALWEYCFVETYFFLFGILISFIKKNKITTNKKKKSINTNKRFEQTCTNNIIHFLLPVIFHCISSGAHDKFNISIKHMNTIIYQKCTNAQASFKDFIIHAIYPSCPPPQSQMCY